VINLYPGLTGDDRIKAIRRTLLEREVQNLFGPIIDIKELSDATLYGLRDRRRNFDAVRSFANPGRR
jgi:hypothetical protein